MLGRGRIGSGKTLAFTIPTITALDRSRLRRSAGRPRALVLVPTRELAEQVADTFAPLAAAAGTQRLLFSATLDSAVAVLVRHYLADPVVHSVDPPVASVFMMDHHVFTVKQADKSLVVRELASGQRRSLLFTRTKHAATKLAKQLTLAGLPAVELHGNLPQNARARNLLAF